VRIIRSLRAAVPALAVLATALAVGTAAPAQAFAAPSHHVVSAAAGGRSTAGAARRAQTVPPNEQVTGTKPDAAGPVANGSQSGNWSGYAAGGGTHTSVSALWVQPAAICTADDPTAFWVGLDGASETDQAVEQIGTTVDCTSGSPVYFAWYELFPAKYIPYSNPVDPGDNMFASATYTGGGYYDLELIDYTLGWTENNSYYDPGRANSSAEIIAEAPLGGSNLADFGSVGFSGSTIDGRSLAAAGAGSVTMVNNSDAPVDTVSAVNAAGNFTVVAGNGGNVTGTPIAAIQATGLWSVGAGSGGYLGQTMAAGTGPSITALPGGGFEGAFQNSDGRLVLFGTYVDFNAQAGMMPGTSPSIAADSSGFEVAFQANTGYLWYYNMTTYGSSTTYAMAAGTSPSITALTSGGFETAFQANTGALWTVGAAGNVDTGLIISAATSPAIATNSADVYEAAFHSSGGQLWTYSVSAGASSIVNTGYSMMAGTDPALTALPDNSFEIAFQASTGHLWDFGPYYTRDTELGMLAGTSPSITADPSVGFEVAFQSNTGNLWVENPANGGVSWILDMRSGTSPAIAD
jgi:hypothetical protein